MIFAKSFAIMKMLGRFALKRNFSKFRRNTRNCAHNFVKIHEISQSYFLENEKDIFVSALVNRYFQSVSLYPFAGLKIGASSKWSLLTGSYF